MGHDASGDPIVEIKGWPFLLPGDLEFLLQVVKHEKTLKNLFDLSKLGD